MGLCLQYIGESRVPIEIEGFTPDWACDKSLPEIERFNIFHGNRSISLAEMFRVSGDPSDKCFDFDGDLAGVHWVGAHMKSGTIRIPGNCGRHLGSQMRGGEIHVANDAGDWVGAEMRGGLIHIRGNACHLVGGAYRGSAKGLRGGTILVEGNVGNEVGHTMRRGMIAIGGSAGEMLGFNMLAGTILVFGSCGIRPGAGMRRGTIGLLGAIPTPLLLSFRYATTIRPQIVGVMLRDLRRQGFKVGDDVLNCDFDLFHGDYVSIGRGEILMRHRPSLS